MYNLKMSDFEDDYEEDEELYNAVTDSVAELLKEFKEDQMVVASYLFANAIKIWRTNLDDDDYYGVLEDVFDRLLYDEDDPMNRTYH